MKYRTQAYFHPYQKDPYMSNLDVDRQLKSK
jgi:hypothetical protein